MTRYALHSTYDNYGEPAVPETVHIELESGTSFHAVGEVQELTPAEYRILSKHFTLVPVIE